MSKDISSKYDDELENEFSDVDLALDMDYDEKTVSKSKKFDDNFKVIKHYYLGAQEAIAAKMNAVANQGKKK